MAPVTCILLLLLLPGALGDVSTVKDLVVLEGRSVTIPCHYDPQYTRHVKYWCRGTLKDFCSSLARTDSPPGASGKVAITDDLVQRVFTVTMKDLQEGDSGWYWCGVEVGGIWRADDTASVHITVTHGMSVLNSMVVGEEGGSVSIQCLYGYRHRDSVKKWCRSGDWGSCVSTDANGTLEGGPVRIRDDRRGAFTVTVLALETSNAGWYWCAAGQQQVAVHLTVTPRSTTLLSTTSTPFIFTFHKIHQETQ
ncbi:polymeric immunoglobulin receptor-like [Megalops cyprinoides]|uniref:polymeric immunoglobulin receptor-like n=1 Tax=Megalops cyprinoides TaxID=118141 RepID=UPI001864C487|nr:polymeric immunoglobulin receptor-like [Megalops cyprinoides]